MRAVIVPQELVVIAGNVDDLGALARLAQHLLHEVVVRLRPVPAGFQRPAVDDISDEVDGVGIMASEKVQQSIGLRAAGSEVDVGDKQSAKAPFGALFTQGVTSHEYHLAGSCDRAMTIPATDGSTQINDAPLTSANNSAMRQRSDTALRRPCKSRILRRGPVQGAQGSTVSIDKELVVICPCLAGTTI